MIKKLIFKIMTLTLLISLQVGCGTTTSGPTLTPQQRKQIQEMDATLARWRIQDYYGYYSRDHADQR